MGLFTGREVPDPKPRSRTLMDAVRDDDHALVSETLARGERVTQTNAYGRTPLHKAAYYSGEPGVIESIIERGADVEHAAQSSKDVTGNESAMGLGHREYVRRGGD